MHADLFMKVGMGCEPGFRRTTEKITLEWPLDKIKCGFTAGPVASLARCERNPLSFHQHESLRLIYSMLRMRFDIMKKIFGFVFHFQIRISEFLVQYIFHFFLL